MAKRRNGYYIVFSGRNLTFLEADCLVLITNAAPRTPALIQQITEKIELVSQSNCCIKNSLSSLNLLTMSKKIQYLSQGLLPGYWEDYFCH